MAECAQEMCFNWTGDAGCPCAVFDIDDDQRPILRDETER